MTAMKTNQSASLPKELPGAVCRQWVRCGTPNCRCARGQLHGPYFARFWRENGKVRKAYVKLSEVDQVRAACEARRRPKREVVGWLDESHRMLEVLREIEKR